MAKIYKDITERKERAKRMGLANKERKHSDSSKLKISESSIGRKSWCKGLIGIKTSSKGQVPWNKGKNGIYGKVALQAMREAKLVKVSDKDIRKIKKLYLSDKSIKEVAVLINYSYRVISRILRLLDIIKDKGWKSRGAKFSKEHCKNISVGRKKMLSISENKKKLFIGKNNPAWLGGKSFEPYGLEFNAELRELIRKRNNYICRLCDESQGKEKLHVHHIDYDKQNNDFINLIALCISCHMKTNMNRNYWKSYFKGILL